ncbi:hypothetical protein ScalyP_jg9620 [Parmales sp. scaly parma]|nr:hypothetical protein ScalyP_jg9620 [Parmales sp. scaly parma]
MLIRPSTKNVVQRVRTFSSIAYDTLPNASPTLLTNLKNSILTLTLNSPKTLNALSPPMVHSLNKILPAALNDPAVDTIHLTSTPHHKIKAFCAGGDVRQVYDAGLGLDPNLDPSHTDNFFYDEYQMNHLVSQMHLFPSSNVSQVTVWDGIVMGGGVGASIHGEFRVATPSTNFAMPETGIGLFPDVGGTWWLPRLPGGIGNYVGLSGGRLSAPDLVYAGIATHYLSGDDPTATLQSALENKSSSTSAGEVLDEMNEAGSLSLSGNSFLEVNRDVIDYCFEGKTTVESIIQALEEKEKEKEKNSGDKAEAEFASKTLKLIRKASPLSLKVTLEGLIRGKSCETIEECLKMEFNMSQGFMRVGKTDFYEGIRALLVDKDNSPKWLHGTVGEGGLELVSEDIVGEFFVVREGGREWESANPIVI